MGCQAFPFFPAVFRTASSTTCSSWNKLSSPQNKQPQTNTPKTVRQNKLFLFISCFYPQYSSGKLANTSGKTGSVDRPKQSHEVLPLGEKVAVALILMYKLSFIIRLDIGKNIVCIFFVLIESEPGLKQPEAREASSPQKLEEARRGILRRSPEGMWSCDHLHMGLGQSLQAVIVYAALQP